MTTLIPGHRLEHVESWFGGDLTEYCVDKQDRIQGTQIRWYKSGQKSETNYVDGKVEGLYRFFNKDGAVITEWTLKKGQKHGRAMWCRSDGTRCECDYNMGKVVRVVSLTDRQGRDAMLPDGEVEVWKACKTCKGDDGVGLYVRLRVPADARRVTPMCSPEGKWEPQSRVEYAIVVSIDDGMGTTQPYTEATSFVRKGTSLVYRVGEVVRPDGYDPDPGHECGKGINVHRYRDQCEAWFRGL